MGADATEFDDPPEHNRTIRLEVAVAHVDDAVQAISAGADRIELSQGLELGGLTPSEATIRQVRREIRGELWVLLRPRAAGFRYDTRERSLILDDAQRAIDLGATGVVAGALTPSGRFDTDFWETLTVRLGGGRCVAHRAFDLVPQPQEELERLISYGTRRVLTSGGAASAWLGRERLRQLVQWSAGRIEVLPAAGIDSDHVASLLKATGCDQIHGTFRRTVLDPGKPVAAADYPRLDLERLKRVRAVLDRLS